MRERRAGLSRARLLQYSSIVPAPAGRERARRRRPGRRARRQRATAGRRLCRCRCAAAGHRPRRVGAAAAAARPTPRAYRLARRLTAGAPNAYDAVKAVEATCSANYSYSERAAEPRRPARRRSCSRTSAATASSSPGAMALMLRMVGIPARVAAGFAPGSYNRDTQRVPGARPGRPLLGRGVLHRHRLGPVRPDARRRAGRGAVERLRRHAAPPRGDAGRGAARGGSDGPGAPEVAGERAPGTARRRAPSWLLLGAARCWRRGRRWRRGSSRCVRAAGAARARRAGRGPARRAAPGARPARLAAAGHAPRCSASSAGCGAPPGPRRPATRPRCATTATTRGRRRAPGLRASGARCAGSSARAAGCGAGCAALLALPPGGLLAARV